MKCRLKYNRHDWQRPWQIFTTATDVYGEVIEMYIAGFARKEYAVRYAELRNLDMDIE